MTKHSHQDAKPPVNDTAQRAAVGLAASPETAVVGRTGFIVLDADSTPVIRGVSQPGFTTA
jgi:hypothetical protein